MQIILLALTAINLILLALVIIKLFKKDDTSIASELRSNRMEINANVSDNVRNLSETLKTASDKQSELLKSELEAMTARERHMTGTLELYSEKLTEIKDTLEKRIKSMEDSNEKKLDEMRKTVDEKLQSTLEERISRSFKEVSERLEQVYKGLGEMQTLATGVGDLKKVLSNVKTRGILGEIQLGSILEEILAPEQYEKDIATVKNSSNRVEFAVKLPGNDQTGSVYLPIDAKFPSDAYVTLCDAYDTGNADEIKAAKDILTRRIKSFADDIRKKYISPPYTTDFGILFLPTEGLYAEAVRLGMVETLQREYNITLSGPTTMAALLNSLQMGFKTLAIQKRSSEVWNTLKDVKKQFELFEKVLGDTQKKLEMASKDLDTLVGVRTRQIVKSLRNVELLPDNSDDTNTNDLDLLS